jgi:hypothetical protein
MPKLASLKLTVRLFDLVVVTEVAPQFRTMR